MNKHVICTHDINHTQAHHIYAHTHMCMYVHIVSMHIHPSILGTPMFTYFHIITYSLLTLTTVKSWREESPTSE